MKLFTSLLIAVAVLLCGCSDENWLPKPSRHSVYETTDFHPVVQIHTPGFAGTCTGTFVSDIAILTASHCVRKGSGEIIIRNHLLEARAKVVEVMSQPVDGENAYDVALLSVSQIIRGKPSTYPIGDRISVRDTVRLVGYGAQRTTRDGTKLTGTNVIYRISDMLQLRFADAVALRGAANRAGGTKGDSGGPLLKPEGESFSIVGLIQSREDAGFLTYAVDVTRSDVREFIQKQNRKYNLEIPEF